MNVRPAALPRVALALGDPAGIGPEIALKAALDERVRAVAQPLLVGDPQALEWHARACGIEPAWDACELPSGASWRAGRVPLLTRRHFDAETLAPGQVRPVHGLACLDAARIAVEAALRGEVEAVVAAPHTELAISAAGIPFDGYPGFVARATGTPEEDAFLMLCFRDDAGREIRIVHATLHVGVRRALDLLTGARVQRAIEAAHVALRRLGVAAPRIVVSGLNPHAGESGLFGSEEADIIAPAIAAACACGMAAEGPFGADVLFGRTDADAFVVMLHDQGHVAAKVMAPRRSAGVTIGTPVLFSSVGHGSALEIAGRNLADHSAMVEAIVRMAGAARP